MSTERFFASTFVHLKYGYVVAVEKVLFEEERDLIRELFKELDPGGNAQLYAWEIDDKKTGNIVTIEGCELEGYSFSFVEAQEAGMAALERALKELPCRACGCPECDGCNEFEGCMECRGEHCRTHGYDRCTCDCIERHEVCHG